MTTEISAHGLGHGEPDAAVRGTDGGVNEIEGMADGDHVWVWGVSMPLVNRVGNGPVVVTVPRSTFTVVPAGIRAVIVDTGAVDASRTSVVRIADGTVLTVDHAAHPPVCVGDEIRLDVTPRPVLARRHGDDPAPARSGADAR